MDMFHQDEEVLGGFCSLEEEVCVSEEQTYYDLVRSLMTEGRLYLRQLNLTIKIFREPFCGNPTLYSQQVIFITMFLIYTMYILFELVLHCGKNVYGISQQQARVARTHENKASRNALEGEPSENAKTN